MRPLILLICTVLLLPFACVPPDKNSGQNDINIDLQDKVVQRLYNFRDQRNADSLRNYLDSPVATYRYLAAMAFGSFRDSASIDAVAALLQDPVEDVRTVAAFSLGQIGTVRAVAPLVRAFRSDDSLSVHQYFNSIVLEAVGKCGGPEELRQIATVSTYTNSDTLLLLGQCRAILRFALRGITDTLATAQMINMIADERKPESARLVAAHYLSRAPGFSPDSLQAVKLAAAYVRSVDPDIRYAVARALGRSKTSPSFGILSKVIRTEKDWRVKSALIGSLAGFGVDTVRSLLIPLVRDPNLHIAGTAAQFFVENGNAVDGDYYWRIANDEKSANLPWEVRVALFRASNRWLSGKPESKDFVNFRLREMFLQSGNPYERAACLHALSEYGWQYRWIYDKGHADDHPAVRTACAEALANIAGRDDFFRVFGEGAAQARRDLYSYFRSMITNTDPGQITASSAGLMAEALNYRSWRDTSRIADFRAALGALKMPQDIEAYRELEKTIAFFENKTAPVYQPAYNHPIDWNQLGLLTASTRVRVTTAQGDFDMELLPYWAPGTVANFLDLLTDGFFDGGAFHRVVPAFVIQGGCPRGDGYGALDYTIRSEHGMAWYDKGGYVGMASAGPDTEGTQWFVTHTATPHLDGRYTLFGRVVKGMEVVDKIRQGTKIEKVALVR